jgi:hypothetical protein
MGGAVGGGWSVGWMLIPATKTPRHEENQIKVKKIQSIENIGKRKIHKISLKNSIVNIYFFEIQHSWCLSVFVAKVYE